jgi:hypothetical protein
MTYPHGNIQLFLTFIFGHVLVYFEPDHSAGIFNNDSKNIAPHGELHAVVELNGKTISS